MWLTCKWECVAETKKMKARSYQANIIPMTEVNKRRKQRIRFFLCSLHFGPFLHFSFFFFALPLY